MDKKFKDKIVRYLRRMSFQWPPRDEKKKEGKIGPATFTCESCNIAVYEGSREVDKILTMDEFEAVRKHLQAGGKLIAGKIDMDHITKVVPSNGFKSGLEWDWNEFMENLFCPKTNFQRLCVSCHDLKSAKEKELKKAYVSKKKANK